jgi:hypothetical protein
MSFKKREEAGTMTNHDAANKAFHAMTGDDLITLVTKAATDAEATRAVEAASVQARYSACDILYIDADHHGMSWMIKAIVRTARA